MTRKHFIRIADDIGVALSQEKQQDAEAFVFDILVPHLCQSFKEFNPHFDQNRFIERIEEWIS